MARIDPKRFEIKHARRPAIQGGLSSTVVVDGTGFVDVSFNEELVKRAGKILPRGVSDFTPAFMTLRSDKEGTKYTMYVQYVGRAGSFKLLQFEERPKWLQFARPLPGKEITKETGKRKNHDPHITT